MGIEVADQLRAEDKRVLLANRGKTYWGRFPDAAEHLALDRRDANAAERLQSHLKLKEKQQVSVSAVVDFRVFDSDDMLGVGLSRCFVMISSDSIYEVIAQSSSDPTRRRPGLI